ncbi:MAG TPA: DNA topoisomerase VI subunit B [Thermoplasmata archaeon]
MASFSIAEELAKKQREISISEFFERNKQILGYDSPTKALLTAVKEAVDNSLDAASDADILPEIHVEIRKEDRDEFRVTVEDNGPGIVKKEVANVFGRLLYGSRFHSLKQSVHPDEPVCVLRGGSFEILPIRAIGERVFEDGEEGSLPLLDEVLTPCFSRSDGTVRWQRATHIIRHRTRQPMRQVHLDHGGSIRVTANHSLFSFSPVAGIQPVAAGDIKAGDYVLAPRRLPDVEPRLEANTLNLIEHIPQGLISGRRWYVYGVPDRVITEIEASPRTRHRIRLGSKKERYFYVYRQVGIPVENFRSSYRRKSSLPLWFAIATGLAKELVGCTLRTYQSGTGRRLDLPADLSLNEDLAWFLGLYVAEGHAGARQSALTLGLHEGALAERAMRIVKHVFRMRPKIVVRKNSLRVSLFSDILCLLLRRWCGDGAFSKRVPEFIFRAPSPVRRAFMEGMYAGDGSNATPANQLDYSTVSPRLANELVYLWRLEGVIASIKEVPGGRLGRRPRRGYRVSVFGEDLRVLPVFPLKSRVRSNQYRRFPAHLLGLADPASGRVVASRLGALEALLGKVGPMRTRHVDRLEGRDVGPLRGRMDSNLRQREFLDAANRPTDRARAVLAVASAVEWFGSSELALMRVESVETLGSPPWVYDLSVPGGGDDENFVAGARGPVFVKNSRGQQGLGISGAIMYGQVTTGKPTLVRTRTAEMDVGYEVELIVDTRRNKPSVQRDSFVTWDKPHGTRVEIPLKGRYISSKQGPLEYVRATAIVNPHARIVFKGPDGESIVFERATEELPPKTVEIKPHPYGIELGTFLAMAKETKSYRLTAFLEEEFSRISSRVAKEICEKADVSPDTKPKTLDLEAAKKILDAIKGVKIMAPPTDCLSPIGEKLIKKGLKNVLGSLKPEFFSPPLTRDPAVWKGNPFQVEVGIVYGGELPPDQPVEFLRFANRVPLLYQAGACGITQAAQSVDWRRYGLEQRGGQGLPYGAAIILVHVASVKIPFTSEAKEAVAPIPEIMEELDLALKECGRRLKTHLTKKARRAKTREKFEIVQRILPKIAEKSAKVVDKKVPNLDATITKIMGVVWIEESIAWDAKARKHTVTVDVHNFTPAGKKFNLHALLPRAAKLGTVDPKPAEVREDGKITWELKRIASVEKATVTFELTGLDKDEYDEAELYVSGISSELVIGAEPLPGDWELNYTEFETEEAPPPAEDEGEIDYDETEEVLEDD